MTYQSLSPFDGKLIKGFVDLTDREYDALLARIAALKAERDKLRDYLDRLYSLYRKHDLDPAFRAGIIEALWPTAETPHE